MLTEAKNEIAALREVLNITFTLYGENWGVPLTLSKTMFFASERKW